MSFSLVFVANSYSSESYNEFLSNRISECATQNTTTDSVNFNYQLTNSNSDDTSRESLSKNITLIYDISRQSTATHFYIGRVIFDGSKKIFNFKDLSNDYPTIILSNIFSNHENPNGEIVHDIFELKLMYGQSNTSFVNVYDNFCYITLNQADELLHKYNLQTYDELINKTLVISTNDGTLLEWKIANIIIDGGDNEYYQKLYGDYVLAYYFTDRIGDTFGNLNTVGGMFALASTILFYYIFKHKKWYFLLLIVEVLFAILTAVTGSKSALVLFVLGFLINLYFLFGKKKIIWYVITVIGFIVLFIVILLLPPFEVIKDRFIDMFLTLFSGASYDLSTAQRYNMFVDGVHLWLKNIFFGNGSQAFSILTSYGTYSHSTVSELLCNFGLVGFILFYLSFIKMITRKNKSRFYPLILSFSISFLLFRSIISVIYISKHIIIFGSLLAAISFLDNDESDRSICINFEILHKK